VATALARGLSSSYAMTGQQQVFLGSASLALQGLLLRPQVCEGWCGWGATGPKAVDSAHDTL
jgi:hypothetical protein